jgi:predicted nucleotidyltransferase
MFKAALKKIAISLQSRQIPYIIIGGQAVLVYGEPRLTRDIDVTLGVDIDKLKIIQELFFNNGFSPIPKDIEKFVKETNVLPLEDPLTGIRVDCIFSFSPYEQQAIQRARQFLIDDVHVSYASPEDVIIHKLVAGRPRDIEDVKGIVNRMNDLDEKYLMEWLDSFSSIVGRDLSQIYTSLSA